jgi:hypothetical protein
VGSIRFDGVQFVACLEDHETRHVHGFYAETEVIVELRENPGKEARLARRTDAVRPGNASRSEVKHMVLVAAAHFNELVELWEKSHA